MKKKLLILLLAFSLSLTSVVACGDEDDSSKKSSKKFDVDDALEEVEELMDDEEWKDAIEICDEILDEDDECVEAYLYKAECYINLDKMDKAEKTLTKGLKKTDDNKKIQKMYDKYFANAATEAAVTTETAETTTEAAAAEIVEEDYTSEYADITYESEIEHVATDDGQVLNIYVWNEEFKQKVESCMPEYKYIDSTTGQIGDVTVNWIINASEGSNYQDKLDAQMEKQLNGELSADDKVDIFLVEYEYAFKYTASDYTLYMNEIGLDNSVFSDQFQYTKDIVTYNGQLKGASWQACPGVLIYNRKAAKDVLGSDDPDVVQEAVKDWDTFNDTAVKMKKKGYNMVATVNDSYRVYMNNVNSPWVINGKINIDDNLMNWVEDSKALADAGETTTDSPWSEKWNKGFYGKDLKVFCYFGPAWFFNFCMQNYDDSSIAAKGGWGVVKGPQSFFWGGTWICAANGTDNKTLVADFIRTMTTDDDVLENIVTEYDDFVNDSYVMRKFADDKTYSISYLGGQNPIPVFLEGIDSISMANISAYDQGCNDEFQDAMMAYFKGNMSMEEALDQFYSEIEWLYPELSY